MSRWNRKDPLELYQWSLLRSIGLSTTAAIGAQVFWLVVVAGLAIGFWRDWELALPCWALGAFSIRYITSRLGGRPAIVTSENDKINADSPFQFRLICDIFFMIILAVVVFTLIFGKGLLL